VTNEEITTTDNLDIAAELGGVFDSAQLPQKSLSDAKQITEVWFESGLLYEAKYHNKQQRKDHQGVFVNFSKQSGTR